MRYKLLGRSGLKVSELCLGTMTFGEDWGWGASKEESRTIYDAFIEAGGNFIDTANLYTNGSSESLLGEFIGGSNRQRIVLATKYANKAPGIEGPNAAGNSRKSMMEAVESSLKRLRTDYIDLYWLHIWDFLTPVEEVMRAFDDLVRQGKVLYVGISDTPAWQVSRANMLAELRGWTPFVALQVEYNLIERTPERELLPMAAALGLAVTCWSPLAGGVLTGKYADGKGVEGRFAGGSNKELQASGERANAVVKEVLSVAKECDRGPAQVALAWLRSRNPSIIPLVGARRLAQLKDNLACLTLHLNADQIERLNKASAVEMGFPHNFYAKDMVRNLIYAGHRDDLDVNLHEGMAGG